MTSSVDIIIKLNHLVFSICTAQYSSKPTLKQFTNDRKCQWSFDFHLFSFWSTIICFSMIAIFSWMWRKNIMVCFSKVWSPTYDAELNHDFTKPHHINSLKHNFRTQKFVWKTLWKPWHPILRSIFDEP